MIDNTGQSAVARGELARRRVRGITFFDKNKVPILGVRRDPEVELWKVDHIPSGMVVRKMATKEQALAVAAEVSPLIDWATVQIDDPRSLREVYPVVVAAERRAWAMFPSR
jgi:hypothetical protein